jgi:hypothetical protein
MITQYLAALRCNGNGRNVGNGGNWAAQLSRVGFVGLQQSKPARQRKENSIDRCKIMYIYIYTYYIYIIYIHRQLLFKFIMTYSISIENCDAPPIIYQTLLQNATNIYKCKCNARTTAAATWTRVCVGSSDIQPNPACAKISTQFPIALLHELCWCRGCKGKAMPRLVAPCLSRKLFDTILHQETICTAGGVPLHIPSYTKKQFAQLGGSPPYPLFGSFWVPVNSPKCQLMSAGTDRDIGMLPFTGVEPLLMRAI